MIQEGSAAELLDAHLQRRLRRPGAAHHPSPRGRRSPPRRFPIQHLEYERHDLRDRQHHRRVGERAQHRSALGNYRLRFRLFGVCTVNPTDGNPEYRWTVLQQRRATANCVVSGVIRRSTATATPLTRWIDSGADPGRRAGAPATSPTMELVRGSEHPLHRRRGHHRHAQQRGGAVYYDLVDVRFQGSNYGTGAGTNYDMNLSAFSERSGSPCLRCPTRRRAHRPWHVQPRRELGEVRGTPPRYYRDCILVTRACWTPWGHRRASSTPTRRARSRSRRRIALYRTPGERVMPLSITIYERGPGGAPTATAIDNAARVAEPGVVDHRRVRLRSPARCRSPARQPTQSLVRPPRLRRRRVGPAAEALLGGLLMTVEGSSATSATRAAWRIWRTAGT